MRRLCLLLALHDRRRARRPPPIRGAGIDLEHESAGNIALTHSVQSLVRVGVGHTLNRRRAQRSGLREFDEFDEFGQAADVAAADRDCTQRHCGQLQRDVAAVEPNRNIGSALDRASTPARAVAEEATKSTTPMMGAAAALEICTVKSSNLPSTQARAPASRAMRSLSEFTSTTTMLK